MPRSSAATALRESFGDRKLPDISRKITACVSCRKLKIKCHMDDSGPPCSRCKDRGLSCTVNKSLQMLLENDASWKEEMEHRIDRLEDAFSHNLHQNESSSMNPADNASQGSRKRQKVGGSNIPDSTSTVTGYIAEESGEATLNLSCNLGAFPASSMVNLTADEGRADYRPDLISCGIIAMDTAEQYFTFYQQNLDPCVYHVLADTDTLADVRARSSILTAAIFTVVAFCTNYKGYRPCLKALKKEVSAKLFQDRYEFDDVRALCIGAFWLSDVASTLNGLAVRMATQLDLHRCITKMPHTNKQCYDRTRLYFLVYLCDHHCSLVYGRPPMTREMGSLKSPGAFVQSKFSTRMDLRLISQVELWSINRHVFNHFGADIESPMIGQRITKMERFNDMYDTWYQTWLDVPAPEDVPDNWPRGIFDLYFYAAKLYLFSHAFRGPAQDLKLSLNSDQRGEWAHDALQNALAIVKCIIDESDAHQRLERLPFYFGTMVAFASVCLIRSVQEQSVRDIESSEILGYLRRLVDVLRTPSTGTSPTHTLLSISKGLEMATKGPRPSSHDACEEVNEKDLHNMSFDFDIFANDALNFEFPPTNNDWMSIPDELGLQLPDLRQL